MASKTFEVKNYRIALHRDYEVFGAGNMFRCSGRIVCTGRPRGASTDYRLQILFVPPDSEMPPNTTDFDQNDARIYLRESRFPGLLALLDSGESIYAYVNDTHPLSNQVRTSYDPVEET